MKRVIFLSVILLFIIGRCTQQEVKSPLEGAWQLISGTYITPDTVMNYPVSINGKNIKMVGGKYFATIWQDTTIDKSNWWSAGFNGGTYTIVDGVYTETETHFSNLSRIGSKPSFNLEIKNDTAILTAILPPDTPSGYSNVEKWKRLE